MVNSFKRFWNSIGKRECYIGLLLIFSFIAYMPSFLLSKIQFEDFHRELYIGSGKKMLGGRWGIVLWNYTISHLEVNDILEKFIGYVFVVLASIVVACIFYHIKCSDDKIMKYSILSIGLATYPLLNEIWSYNGANYVVTGNMFIASIACYYILSSNESYLKKIIVVGSSMTLVASSYESGVFYYITLVLVILFLKNKREKTRVDYIVKEGLMYAIPLILSVINSIIIGKIICFIFDLNYERYGATNIVWGESGAFIKLLKNTFEMYFVRGLVYFPIMIFVICFFIFVFYMLFHTIYNRNYNIVLLGGAILLSLFFQSIVQGAVMPYRTAQTLNIFVGLVFFLVCDFFEKQKKQISIVIIIMMIIICYRQSVFFNKINLLDYKIYENDANLVRQLGFELTSNYTGKPVLFVGKPYIPYYTYSDYLYSQMTVDDESFRGNVYSWFYAKLYGMSIPNRKYIDTNLYSTLFLLNIEEGAMEDYFSYCGYEIDVLNNTNIAIDYPEVFSMMNKGEVSQFEMIDMGEYVVVGL